MTREVVINGPVIFNVFSPGNYVELPITEEPYEADEEISAELPEDADN